MKSEPSVFGIDHLARCPRQIEPWDGVRNYQARNMMRDEMKPGDQALFYHSNCDVPGIVGLAEIVSQGYPDPTAFDPAHRYFDPKSDPDRPRWFLVDVKFKRKFKDTIPLSLLREQAALRDMKILQKGNRLSITPVSQREWACIMKLVP
jgi:predicted RNA-binding protein with PUA-like domain